MVAFALAVRAPDTMHTSSFLAALSLSTVLAAQVVDPQSSTHYLQVDSGLVRNSLSSSAAAGLPQVVWSQVVTVSRASWLRLHYQGVQLSGSPNPGGDGSFLRLTSMRDGAVQLQHLRHVGEWQDSSAYFNGDSVLVELLAQPGTGDSRFVLKCAVAGPEQRQEPDSICGTVDDRVPSSDPRSGRVGFGCTAWMINDCNHCFLSAGHCGVGSTTVIQFNVPLSTTAGNPVAPPPSDQYAVDPASIQSQAGGATLGNDWVYFGCFANSNTGLTPYEAQGSVAYDLVSPAVSPGQTIRITGFGSTSAPVSPTWNLIQKTHTGPFFNQQGNVLQYTVDTTGGNSGSPIEVEGTNEAIGIHTNAGCNSVGGNQGCSADNAALQAALANPQGVCAAAAGACAGSTTYGTGCVRVFSSFYEQLTQAGMDLSGREIYGTVAAGGHTVNTRAATIAAIGSLGAATQLALGDDASVAAGTLGLWVGSNGWVARGPGNATTFAPSVTTLLSNPSAALYAWTDLQPNASTSGKVYYEESGTEWMVTYDGVLLWNTNSAVTIQFRGDEANGDFVIAFGALGSTGPEDWLVGVSGAGPSLDPGPRDLSPSTAGGFFAAEQDFGGLQLNAVGAPVLGAPFELETTNIAPTAVFHVGVMGFNQVSAPLAAAFPVADPACRLYASFDAIYAPQVVLGGPGSLTWTGVDLTSVSALGVTVQFQAVTLELPISGSTVRTSNGVQATTGL